MIILVFGSSVSVPVSSLARWTASVCDDAPHLRHRHRIHRLDFVMSGQRRRLYLALDAWLPSHPAVASQPAVLQADLAPGRCGHCLVFGHDLFQYFLEYVGERL